MSSPHAQFKPALRPDLAWFEQQDALGWIVEDPVSSRFFRLSHVEYVAAFTMNGRQNLAEIKQAMCRRFPALMIDQLWVDRLFAKLRAFDLLVAPSSRNQRLPRASSAKRNSTLASQLLSPLAIRIPLFDPTWLARRLLRPAQLLFHPWVVTVAVCSALVAAYLVLRQLASMQFNLAAELQAVSGDRLLLVGLAYLVAKSLHELGHVCACAYHRTQCREVGLLLLCLAPCLYCDTTDSWRLKSKWKRCGIAAAGMYIELMLATLAAATWLATGQGTVHYLAATMMVICSVGTVLINSNPLLRYDGYFILSDIWGIPNLAEQSRSAVQALVATSFTGQPVDSRRFSSKVWLLAAYGISSGLYRVFVLGLILFMCWHILVPRGLGLVAIAVTGSVALGVALSYINSVRTFWRETDFGRHLRFMRVFVGVGLLLSACIFLSQYEFPTSVRGRGVTDYADKVPVFASQSAEVVYVAPIGKTIAEGETILQLAKPESEFALLELAGEVELLQQELQQLKMRRAVDPMASYQIPATQEELNELLSRQDTLHKESMALSYMAPFDGVLLAGEATSRPALTTSREERFVVRPTDGTQLGGWVARGSLLGWFTSMESVSVSAILPEDAVRKLAVGLSAQVRWDSEPTRLYSGSIVRIATEAITETPVQLAGDSRIASIRDADGRLRPEMPHYEVTILVDSHEQPPMHSPVSLRIQTKPQTLVRQFVEVVTKNLKPIY